MTSASTGSEKCSTRLARVVLSNSRVTSGLRIMPGRIGGVLRHPDHAEIDIGIQNAFLVGREFLGQRTAVRPVDHRVAAAGMQEGVLFGGVAELVDHRLRDDRAGAEEEAGAFDRIDLAGGVVDLMAERMRERIVQRKTRPGADMHLLVLGVHRVFRQRLQVLPAAQRAEPADVGAIMDREIAAVAFAEHGALGMGRPQFPALGDGFAVGADQPLRDIKTAAVALGQPEHRGQFGALHGVADFLRLRAVNASELSK